MLSETTTKEKQTRQITERRVITVPETMVPSLSTDDQGHNLPTKLKYVA